MKIFQFDTLTELVSEGRKKEYDKCRSFRHSWKDGDVCRMRRIDAYRLAEFGWPEGAARAAAQADKISSRAMEHVGLVPRHEVIYDVAGAAYDVGAVMAGVPEAWARTTLAEAKKEVRLLVNIGCSGGVPEDLLVKRGIAVCALALTLQAAGYGVTIDACATSSNHPGGSPDYPIFCRIADAKSGSQLDLDRIVYVLGHPTAFRYLFMDLYYDHDTYPSDPRPLPPDVSLYVKSMKLWEPEWEDPEAWVTAQYLAQTQEA